MIRSPLALLTVFLCALVGTSPLSQAHGAANPRPNILFIYTDDQAPWTMGAAVEQGLYRDVPVARTPNLDQLAREGALLTNSFCATPVCSPARAAVMTGRYASEFGILDFIPHPGHKLYEPERQVALDPDKSVTFAEVLQDHGYATGLVGKWHLGNWTATGDPRRHPTNHGFDYFMGLAHGGCPTKDPELEENGEMRRFEGLTTDILTDRALSFIEKHKEGPFLLCLNTRAPHGAWLPVAPEDWAPYEDMDPAIPEYPGLDVKKTKSRMREYLASVTGIDRNLGRLLDRLDQLGLREDTIVIYSSDHGYNMGHNGIWHKGNGIWATVTKPPGTTHQGTRVVSDKYRPNMYDNSLKVPTVIRWPGRVNPGTVIGETTSALDFFPTLVEIAGAELPPKLPLRGRSLVPLLDGQRPHDWPEAFYAEYHMINYVTADMRCIRTPKYKLIRDFHNDDRDEFFDLEKDPDESQNLINDTRPEIQAAVRELDGMLKERMKLLDGYGPAVGAGTTDTRTAVSGALPE